MLLYRTKVKEMKQGARNGSSRSARKQSLWSAKADRKPGSRLPDLRGHPPIDLKTKLGKARDWPKA